MSFKDATILACEPRKTSINRLLRQTVHLEHVFSTFTSVLWGVRILVLRWWTIWVRVAFFDAHPWQRQVSVPSFPLLWGTTRQRVRRYSTKRHHFPHGTSSCKTVLLLILWRSRQKACQPDSITRTASHRDEKFFAKFAVQQNIKWWIYCTVCVREPQKH